MGLIRSLGSGWPWQERLEREEPVPLEGTRMDLFNSIIPNWWDQNINGNWVFGNQSLVDRVWVAARCQQLVSQQIASMPLEWHGTAGTQEPAWVSNPDPNLFPNGISDAIFCIVDQVYGWGFSCQYVTDFYADGFPRSWTVLDSSRLNIRFEDGARQYKYGEDVLNPRRVVQIDRNPTLAAHGTSAISAYAQQCWALLAAQNQTMSVTQGGIPQAVLKSARKLTKEQAEALQAQWVQATQNRGGAPPVLPPELDFSVLSINPTDLALLDTQEWNARVIATAYGVPAIILNMALQGSLAYQTPVALMQAWWLTELRPMSKRIMDAFSAQLLPRGQWVTQDARDSTIEGAVDSEDDPQLSQAAKASPAQQPGPLTAIGGGGG